jgi:hypothetical protein
LGGVLVLLRDLHRAWPPVSDPTVRPDLCDEVIAAWSKGQRSGKIGVRLRKPTKYANHTIEYDLTLRRLPQDVFWLVLTILKNTRMTLRDVGQITIRI